MRDLKSFNSHIRVEAEELKAPSSSPLAARDRRSGRPLIARNYRSAGARIGRGRALRPRPKELVPKTLPHPLSAFRGQRMGANAMIRGGLKEGNFVVTASPALLLFGLRSEGVCAGCVYGRVCRPCPSGFWVDPRDGR